VKSFLKILLFITVVTFSSLSPFSLSAQNLIPNPGFEDTDSLGEYTYKPWRWLNTIDYYTGGFQLNVEGMGANMYPNSGECFVGVRVWRDYREMLQVKLLKKLEEGEKYLFSMHVRQTDYGNSLVKSVGVSLYNRAILYTVYNLYEKFPPQIVFNCKKTLGDTSWVKISEIYTAKGDEEYITIGNFDKKPGQALKRKERFRFSPQREAYYNIDDISLYKLDKSGNPVLHGLIHEEDTTALIEKLVVNDELTQKYLEDEIEMGKPFVLKNISFEKNSSKLSESSFGELSLLVSFLNEYPDARITITGYTDNTGSAQQNQRLSLRRAKAVAEYLIRHQIRERRITYEGKGIDNPIADNNTEEGRAKNRRVEVVVTE